MPDKPIVKWTYYPGIAIYMLSVFPCGFSLGQILINCINHEASKDLGDLLLAFLIGILAAILGRAVCIQSGAKEHDPSKGVLDD